MTTEGLRLLILIVAYNAESTLGTVLDQLLGAARGAARRGGMPLYKLLGIKLLSSAQNALGGARFSEWHSRYRLYRVSTPRFRALCRNSNDFRISPSSCLA